MLTRSLKARPRNSGSNITNYSTVLLKCQGEGPFLIQERRREQGVDYAGRYAMFGGRQQGGESPEGCAVREVLEETGLHLDVNQLIKLGRIEGDNEMGQTTFGHLFLAEDLDFPTLQDLEIKDGKGVFLKRSDLARFYPRVTSITLFALGAYEDLMYSRRLSAERESPKKEGFSFKWTRTG